MEPPDPNNYLKPNGNLNRAAFRQAQKTYRTWLRTQGRTDVAEATGQSSSQAWSETASDFGSELAGVAREYLGGSSALPSGSPPSSSSSSSSSSPELASDPLGWAQANPIPTVVGLAVAAKLLRVW